MKQIVKHSVVIVTLAALSSCSFMSPVKVPPDTGYVINTVPTHIKKSRRHSATLLVMKPETNPAYDTTRMAFTLHPYQVSYYSSSRWIETPAEMLAPLLAKTMEKTGRFKSIITPPFSGRYDYALRSQIKLLQIDYARSKPVMQLDLQVQLISASSNSVIASREFKASVPLRQASPYSAVIAANQANEIVMAKVAAWTVNKTR